MAKKTDVKVAEAVEDVVVDTVTEPKLVEVEHALSKGDSSYFGKGFRVFFVDGKAVVTEEVAKALKEANVIK